MTDIKSQILAEVEESLGSHAVMVVADAMERCPTISAMVKLIDEVNNSDNLTSRKVVTRGREATRGEIKELISRGD